METGEWRRTWRRLAGDNRFDSREWAGAFGDLGTLIPFVVAYVTLLGMDPVGILFGFGIALVANGLLRRTPFPVQPMKAIGAAATAQAAGGVVFTPGAVYAAGFVTGLVWLLLALTGIAERLARLTPRPVVAGIVLGLGLGFMGRGIDLMLDTWWLALAALAASLPLLDSRRLPAMFALLLIGGVAALLLEPGLVGQLLALRPGLHLPSPELGAITLDDLAVGALFLALPQLPLTLGNALIAVTDENNRLFPDRPVRHRGVALSTAAMNLAAPLVGGVPMCHGAGGMAGHVRFGAHTGGAPIILGSLLLLLALFLGDAVVSFMAAFPPAVLGVILFLAGTQLALGAGRLGEERGPRFVALVTTGLALWNVGAAFIAGLALHALISRGVMKP